MSLNYDIFISYRLEGGYETAKHLYDLLSKDGYTVSFDIDTLRSGDFDSELLSRIDQAKDFIIILNKTALDRCMDPSVDIKNDWLRNELAYALKKDKNIIPILASDFVFPDNLPEDIAKISYKNGIHYNKQYFDAMYGKIKEFLIARPRLKRRRNALISMFVVVLLGLVSYALLPSRFNGGRSGHGIDSLLSRQVLISARLLDTVFLQTDSVIAKAIDYDAYMGISRYEDQIDLGPFYDEFHYIDVGTDGHNIIRPYGRYVGDYYQHDSITMQNPTFLLLGEDEYTNLHYPVLDVSVVNNSQQTILINDLLIEVERSYTDPNPFVIMRESSGKIFIEDRGWHPWKNAVLRFTLMADGQPFDGRYRFEVPIEASDDDVIIPMYDYLVQSGIDFDRICTNSLVTKSPYEKDIPWWRGCAAESESAIVDSLKKMIYPVKLEVEQKSEPIDDEYEIWYHFNDPSLVMHGELQFDNGAVFKVGGTVRFLTSEGYGAPYLDCSRVFDVKLRTDGENYTVKFPVSHYLKAGDVDRIAIQLDADKTSYHILRVRLHNVNQIDIQTEPIDLLLFKYRNSRYYE